MNVNVDPNTEVQVPGDLQRGCPELLQPFVTGEPFDKPGGLGTPSWARPQVESRDRLPFLGRRIRIRLSASGPFVEYNYTRFQHHVLEIKSDTHPVFRRQNPTLQMHSWITSSSVARTFSTVNSPMLERSLFMASVVTSSLVWDDNMRATRVPKRRLY